MAYRTTNLRWVPHSKKQWVTFTAARLEAAQLWNDLVERHFRIRRRNLKWPSKARWQGWAKKKYPHLIAQSAQQIIGEFCEAVESSRQLRKKGHEAKYPWRKSKYRDVIYTNQSAVIRKGYLTLPNGQAGKLRIKIPETLSLSGRLMEARLSFGEVILICEIPDAPPVSGSTIGVDLGVNTLIAATDGETAVLISGREVKSTVQWRNKNLASLSSKQSSLKKGSRRWKKVQRRKYKMLDKARHRVDDIVHKATRKVADAFPGAKAYVGKPFNDAAQKIGKKSAQQVSQACNARIIQQLDYKLSGAIEIEEHWTSQTCPVCGERSKHRRIFRCSKCGTVLPRDVVGSVNIRTKGMTGSIQRVESVPREVKYLRPTKVGRSSSGGHPASRSSLLARGETRSHREIG